MATSCTATTCVQSHPMTLTRQSSRQANRPLVYITRRIPQEGLDILLKSCDVKLWDSEQLVLRGELLQSVAGVDAILCMQGDIIDEEVLSSAGPQLRVVATMTTGTKHIDMTQCKAMGIKVISCPEQPTDVLAELSVVLVLLTIKTMLTDEDRLNNLDDERPDLIAHSDDFNSLWNTRPRLIRQMSEERLAFQWTNGKPGNMNCPTWRNITKKTFGVYGMTKLGFSVVKLLRSVGVDHVIIADKDFELDNKSLNIDVPECQIVSFEDLLKESDIICVCGSAGEQSKNIFCRESFEKMKNQAILITSQSDEKALDYVDLYGALRDGLIKAAGLNDCNQEPVPFKTPLLGLKNCIFLPQTEESVYDMRHKISVLIAKNLVDALKKRG
ncbi:glyoxylate reductase/hydroxypyruvate reductase-like [Biomphalaria glabrata]|uniref:Glyoxylate reductase/hydroxypyruvate reductase-like n=1 Tax=Biomphalaria glabrata TaxID=6526 RepID=A0A9W2YQJ5_BIOGL|nr:glyoxylate reductase/hydroxypyruvate reductase-like [Biomphalaria glabrata]XP_055865005.1 glyoxylate reductase/hydroxypyruvate reductase-like [Biomphalaria glabrata]XP_055865006.1 glyoxylate reductase/hydroxypyruvate reductase-like [Biomphalaria glabrata]XP_055865007.1 glyoxylate reductase/hydroxypyruvate reductase-like [Biomphalaria glabrata]XP_055865008.1 glyoxylate reductase/hydroxypyruvate reductase-like [Biomphalaria glabrata]